MKPIFIFIFCMVFNDHLYASKKITICGKIYSKDSFEVKIFEPIYGYYNQASVDINSNPVIVTKDSFFYSFISLNNTPCFFAINVIQMSTGLPIGRFNFLLCPGDSTHLSIDPDIEGFNWGTFTGDNAAGNNVFGKINFKPAAKFNNLFTLIDNLPQQKDDLLKNIDNIIESFTSQFRSLYNQKEISLEYYESMKKTFMMSFFSVITQQFIYPYPVTAKVSKSYRDSIVENFYQRLSPGDISIKSLYNSFIYMNLHFIYKVYKQKKTASAADLFETDSVIKVKGKEYLINKALFHFLFIQDLKIKEDLWAIKLFAFFQLSHGLFDEMIINQFDSLFPGSKYLKILKEDFEKTSKINNIQYVAQMPIAFADTLLNNNSIDNILTKFKNKVVYIDLWASWCGPCVGSFAYNKIVDSFLVANNIERLYISLDNNQLQWHAAINKYQLGGVHILANEFLIKNIRELFGIDDKAGIGIPHYLIYNKSGRLIFKDAASPINNQQLFIELSDAINQ